MSDFKVKTHHIRFPQGLRPRPRWGSLQRSPKPPSCSGLLLRAREGDGKERRRGGGREGRRGDGICRTNVKLLLICHCRILYDHYLPTVIRIVIYTDFTKAFDTVPHQRLLLKIKTYNIQICYCG